MSNFSLRPVVLVFLLWLAGLGAAAQFAKIAVPFADFHVLYPDAGAGFAWLLSMISVVGIFLGMTAGILAAKFGYIRLLILGLVLGAAVSFWQALLPSFPVMLASRLIEGFSHLSIVVVAPTLIAQISSEQFRGMAMTLWSTFFGVAFAIIAWAGMPFAALHGLSALLSAHGLFMLVVACGLAFAFRSFDVTLPVSNTPLKMISILRQHVRAYLSPNISAPAIGWLFYTLTFVALLAIIPGILPADSRTTIVGLLPLISIASALILVSYLLSWISATSIVIAGFILAAFVGLLTFTGLSSGIVFVSLFGVLGLIQGASFAATVQLNATAEDRALANGAMAQMGNLGNTLGTPILLAILGVSGITGLLLTVCSLYLAGGVIQIFLLRKRNGGY